MRTRSVFLLALALGLCFVLATWAQDADPAAPDRVPGEVLVKFAPKAPPAAVLGAAQAVGAQHLHAFDQLGIRHWRVGNGLTVEGAIEILGKRPFVEFAEPNYTVHALGPPDDPLLRTDLWGMHNSGQTGGTRDADIDATEAWGIRTDASAVVVAGIDSGVDYTHEDLAANMWINPGEDLDGNGAVDSSDFNGIDDDGNGFVDDVRGWDFRNDDNDPMDDNGHGTHTAGTIGAVGDNGKGVAGVCWGARIMPLKFLNFGASGSSDDAVAAILYAASFDVRITSNSWGSYTKSRAVENAIRDSGALFVAAAGNSSSSTKEYPAGLTLANVLSVTATDDDDRLAPFSNFGTDWVDLAAPGAKVLSCVPGNGYVAWDGTSMATPHCAGAAALVLAGSPSLSIDQLKQALMGSVDHVPALAGKCVTGGRLNLFRALGGSPSDPPPEPLTDATAPDAISDLSAGDATAQSVTLSFTASADDTSVAGSGPAYACDVRLLEGQAVTAANWDAAAQVQGEDVPGAPGSAGALMVTGLRPATTYFFAMKVVDDEGNVSGLSNAASATTLPVPQGAWLIETVHSYGLYGTDPSIAVDAATHPHIAFLSVLGGESYARWTGAAWSIEAIPDLTGNDGSGTSIALDASGNAHVTYQRRYTDNLHYAKRSGSGWSIQTIDAGGRDSSLELDTSGFPHIAHTGAGLRYARWDGSQWVKQTVDATGADGSLAVSGSNRCISYLSRTTSGKGKNVTTTEKLMLARWNGAAWQLEVVDAQGGKVGHHSSLALDGSGNPHITYGDAANGDLKYARWTGSSWQIQVVDAQSGYSSLALDAAGNPHVSYKDADGDLKYARWTGSAFAIETVDTAGDVSAYNTALTLDSLGGVHVGHVATTRLSLWDSDLKYARKAP